MDSKVKLDKILVNVPIKIISTKGVEHTLTIAIDDTDPDNIIWGYKKDNDTTVTKF